MRRIAVIAGLVAVLVPMPAAAGGGGGGYGCAGFGDAGTIALRDSCFNATAHFSEDGVVTVLNEGQMAHTYTAVDGSFDTGTLAANDDAELRVPPGVHRVYCKLHSTRDGEGMAGVLIVGEPTPAAAGVTVTDGGGPWTVALAALLVIAVAVGAVRVIRRQAPDDPVS